MGGEWSHDGIACCGCGKNPIVGYRYRCMECKDYNLCGKCFVNAGCLHYPHNFESQWQPGKAVDTALRRSKAASQEIEAPAPVGFTNLTLLTQRRAQLRAVSGADGPINVLMFGHRGVGKTSLINASHSAFQDDAITDYKFLDKHGASTGHHTTMLRCHELDAKCPVRVYDVWGWNDDREFFDDGVLPWLLNGHMKDGFNLDDRAAMHAGNPKWKANPTLSDRMHAVIVVTSNRTKDDYHDNVRKFLAKIQEFDIPYFLVYSKMDDIDNEVKAQPERIYSSLYVQRQLGVWRDSFGVDLREIFPMKGYTFEKNRNKYIETLALDVVYGATQSAMLAIAKAKKYGLKSVVGSASAAAPPAPGASAAAAASAAAGVDTKSSAK